MIMRAIDLVEKSQLSWMVRTVREGLEGNLCRCTGYQNIVKAVLLRGRCLAGVSE